MAFLVGLFVATSQHVSAANRNPILERAPQKFVIRPKNMHTRPTIDQCGSDSGNMAEIWAKQLANLESARIIRGVRC